MTSQVNLLKFYKEEAERFKNLYWNLQLELDKLDALRKTNHYYFYAIKREMALEKLRLDFEKIYLDSKTEENKANVVTYKTNNEATCDCQHGNDEVD